MNESRQTVSSYFFFTWEEKNWSCWVTAKKMMKRLEFNEEGDKKGKEMGDENENETEGKWWKRDEEGVIKRWIKRVG